MAPGSCPGATCVGGVVSVAAGPDVADDVALARRARTTLWAAERGRLVVADGHRGPGSESSVAVFDDGGEPTMVAQCGGPLLRAARRRGHAALLVDADPEFGVGVTLVGRLAMVATERRPVPSAALDEEVSLALTVERVLVSCPRDEVSVTTHARRPIPLDLYALAEPDRVAVEIARMIPHLNRDHGPDVRALAAFCADRPVADVIGAELDHLCRKGFGLRWVGLDGGDEVRFSFPEPARDVAGIARRLQAYVAGASR